jgi:hypothetical protein
MSNAEAPRIEKVAKVWTPDARLIVPTSREVVTFSFPAFGRGTYDSVVKQVLASGQRLPTGEQTAFMLDAAYNHESVKNTDEAKFMRDNVMYSNSLWVPNVNVWTPKNVKNPGMYKVFDENGQGLGKVYTAEELEDRLSGGSTEKGVRFSKDRKVAFSPLSLIRGKEHKKGTLSQDGAFIANYEVEGAEKLDAVAKVFTFKPYSWIVDNDSEKLVQTLSALGRDRGVNVIWLYANFNSFGSDRRGYVLSVFGSGNIKNSE